MISALLIGNIIRAVALLAVAVYSILVWWRIRYENRQQRTQSCDVCHDEAPSP